MAVVVVVVVVGEEVVVVTLGGVVAVGVEFKMYALFVSQASQGFKASLPLPLHSNIEHCEINYSSQC